ncbi:MAG: filamentous hemagglutinin N-terminal domain-containing protein [Betaproteobacteria bacterium]|nr:filamentous hemagglutinin N-terminal domain-containing protein [Betaproteobacteria bacterium]
MKNSSRRAPAALDRRLISLAVASCFAAELAYANPTGHAVASGTASFSAVGSTLTVTNSPSAIINWQGFSIGSSEATRFVQQSAASSVLNRVVGQDPSAILGTLWSNGRVFLVNPNGILFGQGSRVDVAGLVASTLNITDADFLGGRLNFQAGVIANSLVNQGELHSATGGHIYLIAPDVTNSGLITSAKGEVVLAAGKSVSLVDIGTPNLKVEITAPNTEARNLGQIVAESGRIGVYAGLITQTGTIRADSAVLGENGQVLLKATKNITLDPSSVTTANGPSGGAIAIQSALGIASIAGAVEVRGTDGAGGAVSISGDVVINAAQVDASGATGGTVAVGARNYLGSGTISADGAFGGGGLITVAATGGIIQTSAELLSAKGSEQGGKITVGAGERIFSSATLDASGGRGGEVHVLAPEIMLYGAAVDASGDAGGGTVLIGGDYRGGNAAIPNADITWINYSTDIRADAKSAGDGGKVVVWSEKDTRFGGTISVRGGAQSGNGGFIEVSGKDDLVFAGMADASAPNGTPGTVLLDPKNIVIDAAATGSVSSFQLVDPNPGTSENFAGTIEALPNNNVVATDPNDSFVAGSGAIYLFNGTTGALLSTMTGSASGDSVGSGGVVVLSGVSQNNFVVLSPSWNGSRGAATWGNGTSGFIGGGGTVSSANSLVGAAASDQVGSAGVTVLTNGNYVVSSPNWANVGVTQAGAVTWGSGTAGVSGTVTSSNSLVGSTAGDQVGSNGITALTNDNYVVSSPFWDNSTVAANVGAVTWRNGTAGTTGTVGSGNSLVGSTAVDVVGSGGVTALTNGNYVVKSPSWNNSGTVTVAGAVTWGNGTAGVTGAVSSSNSLVGSTAFDQVGGGGGGVTALTNGNYVVSSPLWDLSAFTNVGAVTWGNGTTGTTGTVGSGNSLVGSTGGDAVGFGGVVALTIGNYVVASPNWTNGAFTQAGAVTWGNGTTGITGAVTSSNSLVGSTSFDNVGSGGITALTNGNYVVTSPFWDNSTVVANVGAVTWGNGATGTAGTVSSSNSLVGSTAGDLVGSGGVVALTNGNYVVASPGWNNGGTVTAAGAVTWGNGTTGVTGAVASSNSLVGSTSFDNVGSSGVTALTNGNYVVSSPLWDDGTVAANVGAVTWGNGTAGITGTVAAGNSLVGTASGDQVGLDGVTALTNGNYVVRSPKWNGNVGAATFGNGATGVTGTVSASNSLVGSVAFDLATCTEGCNEVTVIAFSNGNYAVVSSGWDNGTTTDVGAVTFGSGTTGVSGTVSAANSLIGTKASDSVGSGGVTGMSNGNFVVNSLFADNGATVDAGLVHVVSPVSQYFGVNASGDVTIAPAQITQMTNTGTSVVLQANNDITLNASSPITTSAGGAGGAITLQAGRSVMLNSNITTDNGDLTITANDPTAQSANRDAGAGGITMATGTTLNAGTGMVVLTVGAGVSGAQSGNLTVENIIAANVNLQQEGQTNGSSILRASSSSLIQATNLLMEVDHGGLASGGSIGTTTEPMRVQASVLESHTHEASPGIFIDSPNAGSLQIGGVSFFGGIVKGVQNVTSGDISIGVNGTLTLQGGSTNSPCGTGTGGPICTTSGNVTLRADDMAIGHSITGTGTVSLAPNAVNRGIKIESSPSGGVLSLSPSEINLISAGTLEIGRSDGTGTLTVSTPVVAGNVNSGTVRLLDQDIAVNASFASNGNLALNATNNVNVQDATVDAGGTMDVSAGNNLSVTAVNAATNLTSVGAQTISAKGITLTGGGSGASSFVLAEISQTGPFTQSITAGLNGITLNGGNGSGGTNFANIKQTNALGNQTIVVNGGNVALLSGTGAATNSAVIQNLGTSQSITVNDAASVSIVAQSADAGFFSANDQTVTIQGAVSANALTIGNAVTSANDSFISGNNQVVTVGTVGQSGSITVQGGTAAGKNSGIFNNSGTQTVSTTGTLSLTGGTATGTATLPGTCNPALGSGSCGDISNSGTGLQTISANTINIQGGSGGVSNGAGIFVNGGPQQITVGAGGLHMVGGTGTSDNFAVIGGSGAAGQTLTLNVAGDTTLDASNATAGSGVLIGLGGSGDAQTVTVNFHGIGDLTLTGSNVSTFGAGIGAGSFQTNATTNLLIEGRNITLNPGTQSTIGVRFGHPNIVNGNGPGDITVIATGNLALNDNGTMGSAIRTTGNVTLQAASITEGANSLVIAGGTTTLNGGAISLTSASNDFTGAVSINNSGPNNVAITDANAIVLGTSSVGSGTLTVMAGGTITQTGPIVQAAGAGVASFETTGAGSAITLSNAGNDFTGPVSTDTTGAVTITDANSVIIEGGGGGGGITAASYTLNANGTVSQSATFTGTAPAVVVINAGSGPVLLNDPANNLSGNLSVAVNTSGAASFVNTNAAGINLAASSVGGALSLTSGGPITQTGALTVGGASTLSAGSNPITLTNTGNDFTGAVGLTGSNVAITDANAITIGSSSVGGSFDITATSVLFSGGLSVNNYSFTGGTYTLSSGTYNLGGTTTVAGPATVVASGGTINASGGTINVSGVLDSGTSSLSVGTLNVLLGGTLSGTGTIIGNVSNSAGTVSPGASPGILTISGNYVQGPSGVLDMQIGGTTAGTQYDQLIVTGSVSLDGTLNTTLINGFVPVAGNTFTLIQSGGALTGTFGAIVQPTGTTFNTFYGPTTFEFSTQTASVPSAIEPSFNYTVAALDSPLQPLLEPTEVDTTTYLPPAPITETATTQEEQKLAKKPPACN